MKHRVDPSNHDFVELLLQKMVLIVGVLMGIHRDWKMDESAQNYAKQSKKLTADAISLPTEREWFLLIES